MYSYFNYFSIILYRVSIKSGFFQNLVPIKKHLYSRLRGGFVVFILLMSLIFPTWLHFIPTSFSSSLFISIGFANLPISMAERFYIVGTYQFSTSLVLFLKIYSYPIEGLLSLLLKYFTFEEAFLFHAQLLLKE